MDDNYTIQENDSISFEMLPLDMKDRLQNLKDLYSHAENIAQTLEERLQKCTQWPHLSLPSRET